MWPDEQHEQFNMPLVLIDLCYQLIVLLLLILQSSVLK